MPLTPEDVRSKRFTPVRLREGYDMGEVDQFLDEVEAELERLTQDNSDLRSKLTAASGSRPEPAEPTPGSDAATEDSAAAPAPDPAAAPAAEPVADVEPAAPITTISQASGAAARLLELATRNADEVVADAHSQSETILAEARTNVDRMEADARARAQELDAETAERRRQLFGDLEKDRDRLARDVEQLSAFEREYRSRLKKYFSSQLAQLEGEETMTSGLPGDEPDEASQGLRSLPAEDRQEQP